MLSLLRIYWFLNIYDDKYEARTYSYWLWFSLVTQTTVGYAVESTTKDGFFELNEYPSKYKYVYRFINIIQMSSIFLIASLFI